MSKIDLENGHSEQEKLTNGKTTSEMAKAGGDTSYSVCAKIDEVNLLSFVSFSWMFGYLWDSYKGRIDPNLNWSCSIFDSANVNMSRLEHLWNEELKRNPQAPSLFRVIFRFMKGRLIISCAIFLFCLIFGFIGPTCLIRGLIAFTEKPPMQDGSINYTYGFYLVISILLVEISRVLMYGATWAVSYRTGIRVRGAVLALLYKHAINVKSLRNKSPAEIVNIFANDGQRIFDAVTFAPLVLIGPFVLVGGLIYLLRVIGALSLFGILVFFVFDILQAFLGIVMVKCRNLAIEKTEKRMNLMGEIIKCIRVIKVNGWEDLFIKRVVEVRKDERRNIAIAGYAQSLAIASGTIVPVVATFVTVLSVVYSGSDLLASDIFSAVTVFFVMLFGIRMIPYGTRYLAESKNAISKIQDILLYPKYESNFPQPNSVTNTSIVFNNSTFSWDRESSVAPSVSKKNENRSIKMSSLNGQAEQELLQNQLAEPAPCLKNITVTIHKKELIGVCGEVGSGKTALLNACVGQLIEEGGDFAISGSVALVSQHPFVCGKTTIRDNILFGQTMNSQRYYKCISAVQLSKDLESMPANELSEISESGTTLSGGQKARVSLARALYSNRDIYLLDDVFSAVDKSLAQKIFNDLKEMLAHKTCLFATSDPEYLAKCDKVIFLGQGKIIDVGTHQNLLNSQDAYRNLFNSQSQLDNVSRDRSSTQNSTESDEHLSAKNSDLPVAAGNGKIVEDEEDFGLAQISPKVYLDYIRAGGGALVWFFVLLAFFVNVGSGIFSTFWLSKWLTDVHNDTVIDDGGVRNSTKSLGQDENLSYYAMVYGCSLVVLFISGLIKAMIFVKVSLHASTTLHNKMLHRVIRGVVSFFDSTPAGRILNRFSKDIDEIDVKLPFSSEALLQYMITCVGFVSIIAWVFPSFLFFSLPLLLVFAMFFLCFRSGIRSLKRVENISRSPIFEQISTSLDGDGLATIHSYSQTNRFIDSMKVKLDENSGSMLMFHCAMRWQAVWLDLLVVAVTFIVSILIVCLTGSVSPANAGMAIAFAMQMSGIFQFAVRSQTELEAKLTSVERVLYYCKNIQQEQSTAATDDLPAEWPSKGTVSFKNVVLQYPSEPLPALRDISFDVGDHEKVGIIGRTGSGKSSLCNALFQLYDIKSGTIYVDSRDISKISLSRVRRSMAIIPQDPVLFSGPVRFNIDPEGEYSDDQIWKCLDDVGLREIMTTNFAGKLDFIIEEGGRNLSSGQRQIVCVTRALLRNVKIVVLDEATANMDGRTDEHLQSTIRKAFAEKATVLLITHRLNNVTDMNKVLIMDDGKVSIRNVGRNSQQKLEDET